MAFVTLDTNDMVIPVMVPRATTPAVSGWNSAWLIAGAAAASYALFGGKGGARRNPARKTRITRRGKVT